LAKRHSIFSITPSQIAIALKGALNGRLRYFIGKGDAVHPRILARPSTLLTLPTGTNSDLMRLIFNLETASKHKNKAHNKRRCFGFASQKSKE
jgi:hypothetical protein